MGSATGAWPWAEAPAVLALSGESYVESPYLPCPQIAALLRSHILLPPNTAKPGSFRSPTLAAGTDHVSPIPNLVSHGLLSLPPFFFSEG